MKLRQIELGGLAGNYEPSAVLYRSLVLYDERAKLQEFQTFNLEI